MFSHQDSDDDLAMTGSNESGTNDSKKRVIYPSRVGKNRTVVLQNRESRALNRAEHLFRARSNSTGF